MERGTTRKARSFWSDLEKSSDEQSTASTSPSIGSSSPGSLLNSPPTFGKQSRVDAPSIRQNAFVQSDQQQRQRYRTHTHHPQYQNQQNHFGGHGQFGHRYHPAISSQESLFSSQMSDSTTSLNGGYYNPGIPISNTFQNQNQNQSQNHPHHPSNQYQNTSPYGYGSYPPQTYPIGMEPQHYGFYPSPPNHSRFSPQYQQHPQYSPPHHQPYPMQHYAHKHSHSHSPQGSQNFRFGAGPDPSFIPSNNNSVESFNTIDPPSTPVTGPSRASFNQAFATPPRYTHPSSGSNGNTPPVSVPSPTKSALKQPSSDALSSFSPSPIQSDLSRSPHRKAASFLRKGSFGRLLGPKPTNTNSPNSERRAKKAVSFVKTAPEVIQYEALTPEMSFNSSSSSSNDTEEEDGEGSVMGTPKELYNEFQSPATEKDQQDMHDFDLEVPPSVQDEEDHSQDEDSMSNVPIIEPPKIMSPTLMSIQQTDGQFQIADTQNQNEMFGFHHEDQNNQASYSQKNDTPQRSESIRRPLPQLPGLQPFPDNFQPEPFADHDQFQHQYRQHNTAQARPESVGQEPQVHIKPEPIDDAIFAASNGSSRSSLSENHTAVQGNTNNAIESSQESVPIKEEPRSESVYIKREPDDQIPLYLNPTFSRSAPQGQKSPTSETPVSISPDPTLTSTSEPGEIDMIPESQPSTEIPLVSTVQIDSVAIGNDTLLRDALQNTSRLNDRQSPTSESSIFSGDEEQDRHYALNQMELPPADPFSRVDSLNDSQRKIVTTVHTSVATAPSLDLAASITPPIIPPVYSTETPENLSQTSLDQTPTRDTDSASKPRDVQRTVSQRRRSLIDEWNRRHSYQAELAQEEDELQPNESDISPKVTVKQEPIDEYFNIPIKSEPEDDYEVAIPIQGPESPALQPQAREVSYSPTPPLHNSPLLNAPIFPGFQFDSGSDTDGHTLFSDATDNTSQDHSQFSSPTFKIKQEPIEYYQLPRPAFIAAPSTPTPQGSGLHAPIVAPFQVLASNENTPTTSALTTPIASVSTPPANTLSTSNAGGTPMMPALFGSRANHSYLDPGSPAPVRGADSALNSLSLGQGPMLNSVPRKRSKHKRTSSGFGLTLADLTLDFGVSDFGSFLATPADVGPTAGHARSASDSAVFDEFGGTLSSLDAFSSDDRAAEATLKSNNNTLFAKVPNKLNTHSLGSEDSNMVEAEYKQGESQTQSLHNDFDSLVVAPTNRQSSIDNVVNHNNVLLSAQDGLNKGLDKADTDINIPNKSNNKGSSSVANKKLSFETITNPHDVDFVNNTLDTVSSHPSSLPIFEFSQHTLLTSSEKSTSQSASASTNTSQSAAFSKSKQTEERFENLSNQSSTSDISQFIPPAYSSGPIQSNLNNSQSIASVTASPTRKATEASFGVDQSIQKTPPGLHRVESPADCEKQPEELHLPLYSQVSSGQELESSPPVRIKQEPTDDHLPVVIPLKDAETLKHHYPAAVRIKLEEMEEPNRAHTPPSQTIPRFETHADARKFRQQYNKQFRTLSQELDDDNQEDEVNDVIAEPRPRMSSNSSQTGTHILTHRRPSLQDLLPDEPYEQDESYDATEYTTSTKSLQPPFDVDANAAILQEAHARYKKIRDLTPRDDSSPLLTLAPEVPIDTPQSALSKVINADSLGIYQDEDDELLHESKMALEEEGGVFLENQLKTDKLDFQLNPSTKLTASKSSPTGEFGFKNADAYSYSHNNNGQEEDEDEDEDFENGDEEIDGEAAEDGDYNGDITYDYDDDEEKEDEEEEEGHDAEVSTIVARGTKMKARPSLLPYDVSVSLLAGLNGHSSSVIAPGPSNSSTSYAPGPSSSYSYDSYGNERHFMNDSSFGNRPTVDSKDSFGFTAAADHGLPPPHSLLAFDINETESDSLFDDLDKEFDKMLHDSDDSIEKKDSEEKKRHGYFVRENQDIVVATAEQRRKSQALNNMLEHHNYIRQRKISGPIRNMISPRLSLTVGTPTATPLHSKIPSPQAPFSPGSNQSSSPSPNNANDEDKENMGSIESKILEGQYNRQAQKQPLGGQSNSQAESSPDVSSQPEVPIQPIQQPKYQKTSEIFYNDRGRLFVKIIGINDIQKLPNVDSKNAKICMILDNGLHSITTPYKPLHKASTTLDQEFELVVGQGLEFILTFKAKWPKPKETPVPSPTPSQLPRFTESRLTSNATTSSHLKPTHSVASSTASTTRKLGFSRLFGRNKGDKSKNITSPVSSSRIPGSSPTGNTSRFATPTSNLNTQQQVLTQPKKPVVDQWDRFVAQDGSFGRAYISFTKYEPEIYGVAKRFSITCYNEWTTPPGVSTVATPRSSVIQSTPVDPMSKRQAPYQIATLECELMFIPRGRLDESLPGSIRDATKEMDLIRKQIIEEKEEVEAKKQAEEEAAKKKAEDEERGLLCEGSLSQLGGDCRYWRRRYFKLNGATFTLTAYSETSHKARVSINLKKAVRVIEDKNSLVEPMVSVGNGEGQKNRRKSAFAEQEEAFMFVDEGFRVRFGNGEIIDFYADDQYEKVKWVEALRKVVTSAKIADAEEKEKATDEEIKQKKKKKIELKPWVEQVLAYEEELQYPELAEARRQHQLAQHSSPKVDKHNEEHNDVEEAEPQQKSPKEEEPVSSAEDAEVKEVEDQIDEDKHYQRRRIPVRKAEDRDSMATTMNDFIDGGNQIILPKRHRGTDTIYI